LSGQATCLSDGAGARKPPLPDGGAAHSGERRGGINDVAQRLLLSLMTLRRSSQSRPYYCCRQF
jgi:hypothetical protein